MCFHRRSALLERPVALRGLEEDTYKGKKRTLLGADCEPGNAALRDRMREEN